MKQIFSAAVILWIVLCGNIYAYEVKITAEDGYRSDSFGASVCLDGDYAVVGAYGKNDNGLFSGAAYVFVREGNAWKQQSKLLPDDGKAYGHFGWSAAIHGDFIIIGAPEFGLIAPGAAYIFKREGSDWIQHQKLLASDRSPYDYFGASVSISGNYAVIGAYGDGDKGSNSGSAYIFYFNGEEWVQEAKLTAGDAAAEDMFGRAVSISGYFALIGAEGNDDKGSSSGSAYIFRISGTEWEQMTIIVPEDGATNDYFGSAVSIYGAYAAVGAYGRNAQTGAAYLYRLTDVGLEQTAVLKNDAGAPGDAFGKSASVSADHAAVGAYGKNSFRGAAFLYRLDGSAGKQIAASDASVADQFGYSVSVSGGYVISGAYGDSDKGASSGSAYIYVVEDDANLPPTLSDIQDLKMLQNQPPVPASVSFIVDDPETAPSDLTVSFSSSNPSLAPPDKMVFGGQDKQRTLTITPEPDAFGVSEITIRVSDGQNFVSKSFRFIVNDPPQISEIPHQAIRIDRTTGPIPFTISDKQTGSDQLIVTASSSNPILIPETHIVLDGSGADRTVAATPVSGLSGLAVITISVSDGIETVSRSFEVRVSMPNSPPTISSIPDQTIWEDTPTDAVFFKIGDVETPADQLTLSAKSSSNDIVDPVSGVVFSGSGENRYVRVTPKQDANGYVIITVIVSDGTDSAVSNFTVMIKPVNDRPEISPIADVFIDASAADSATVAFTVKDPETPTELLEIRMESSDLQLIPIESLELSGNDENRTLVITPASGVFGAADITIYADDGELIGQRTFKVTVNPYNIPPSVSKIPDMTVNENSSTGTIDFTVYDPETSAELLDVSAASSNQTLVPESGIILGGHGSVRAIHVFPALNQYGTAIITVTVKDNKNEAQTQFTLTVNPIIHPGDLNNNRSTDLEDAIIGLQIMAGMSMEEIGKPVYPEADVNDDDVIGIEEIIYILQHVAMRL